MSTLLFASPGKSPVWDTISQRNFCLLLMFGREDKRSGERYDE